MLILPMCLRTNRNLTENYFKAGNLVWEDISYSYLGEPVDFKDHVLEWIVLEEAYAKRGFTTLTPGDFTTREQADKFLGRLRAPDAEPTFHAKDFYNHTMENIKPQVDLDKMLTEGGTVMGEYDRP